MWRDSKPPPTAYTHHHHHQTSVVPLTSSLWLICLETKAGPRSLGRNSLQSKWQVHWHVHLRALFHQIHFRIRKALLATSVLQTIWSGGTAPTYKVSFLLPWTVQIMLQSKLSLWTITGKSSDFLLSGRGISPEHHCGLTVPLTEDNEMVWEDKGGSTHFLYSFFVRRRAAVKCSVPWKHWTTFWHLRDVSS